MRQCCERDLEAPIAEEGLHVMLARPGLNANARFVVAILSDWHAIMVS